MTLSIAQKLVAAFVGLTVLVLIATLGLARWSFEQGFLDYVNALEQIRLERVVEELAQEYSSAGNTWESMSEQRFSTLLLRSTRGVRLDGAPPGGMPPPPPRGMRPRPGVAGEAPPPHRDGPPPKRRGSGERPPTALYDLNDNVVAGTTIGKDAALAVRLPIMVSGDKVGELRSEPRRQISSPLETSFSRQQLTTSWVLGLSSLLLAFGLSLLLARGLLAPVRRMIASVAELSSGNYSHRMNESRSDELGRLTRDLDLLGSTLEASQSSRKRLLADVSHELRTPLTVLTGEIEALKDGLRKFDRAQLDSLDQEVQRLRFLVDDLYELSISDVGGLKYQFAPLDLCASLQMAVEGMRTRAEAQGIELLMQEPGADVVAVSIDADVRRLDQLLQNLLENSLAYTDAPGRIVIALTRVADSVLIQIDDSPPGVSERDCEQLFDPLFRMEASRSRRTGGAGLGLAVCRNIVAAHGGSITACPSSMGGLSIRIEIPLSGDSHT